MIPGNLLGDLPAGAAGEVFEPILVDGDLLLERIVSTGQATPPGEWLEQERDEWVVVLSGRARLRFEDEPAARAMEPGDHVRIPARRRHRVEWTDGAAPTVWLALHFRPGRPSPTAAA